MNLRPYQQEALRVSKEKFAAGITRQLIQLPTGTGKTPLFACVRKHFGFTGRVMVLVHREELAEQAASKLISWNPGCSVGIEMGNQWASDHNSFVVASVQTIGRSGSKRIQKFNPADFNAVICDEAHHSVAPSYRAVFDHFKLLEANSKKLLLGVTATPNRGDGSALGTIYDEIIYQMPMLDAIKNGWLVDIRGMRVTTTTSLDGVHTAAGDFVSNELSKEVNTPQRNELIVRKWLENANDRQTVVFTVDIAHAKALADAYKQYGVSAEAIWGEDPDRAAKLAYHRSGALRVLCNCAVLTEGYDDPSIGCIVMARPTKSNLLFVQMAGRGTRLPEGINNFHEATSSGLIKPDMKQDCLLMDVVDNTTRHSLVTLTSIFGLGSNLDTKKEKITYVVKQIEDAKKKNPEADFDKLDDISNLKSFVEKVNLFEVKFPPDVMANSQLQWHRSTSGDSYVLLLPNNESVVIIKDLLDNYHVVGSVKGNRFSENAGKSLPEAFHQADDLVVTFGRDLLHLLRREASWHDDCVTPRQLGLLRRLRIPCDENMTKGQAANLITQHFSYVKRKKKAA